MTNCCEDKACEIDALKARQGSVLKWVLLINAVMFVVEISAGLAANSTALLADSLDMLGDALVYGFSLYVIAREPRWQAVSALIKGVIMALFGLFVLGEAVYKMFTPLMPVAGTIGLVGVLALAANAFCLHLLWRHRTDDINMRSVWLCSRNDVIANLGVLLAAAGVWWLESRWPDIGIGLVIAAMFLRSAVQVLTAAAAALRHTRPTS
jgi:cation diffusion facilitator family transporter